MKIQNINLHISQPSFNSRKRINQKNKIQYRSSGAASYAQLAKSNFYDRKAQIIDGLHNSDRTYDSFTGLRDKNYLIAVLNKKMEDCQRNKKSLSVAMFDMDNFKSVNELLGYETGDKFIKTIGHDIDEEAKKNSLHTYRFGGDEFIIVFEEQSPEKQKEIADAITEKINNDKYINSKEDEYNVNAMELLHKYSSSSKKIQELMSLKSKKNILEEVHVNLSTEKAKSDPYLTKTIDAVNGDINSLYSELISECITDEQDESTKNKLVQVVHRINNGSPVSQKELKKIDEYLLSRYDKSAQIYQTKKWISDFNMNNGFSISGGVMTYTPESLQGKTPIDIINITGELLKKGKNTKKGINYIQAV